MIFPDRYSLLMGMYPPGYLALLYNAADVLIACSKTEGFGVPLIEAQACGCPVVTTDFASMPELVRHGIAVRPAGRMWHPHLESWWAVPDVGGLPRRWRRCVVGAADVWAAGGVMQAQAFIKSLVGMWCRRGGNVCWRVKA